VILNEPRKDERNVSDTIIEEEMMKYYLALKKSGDHLCLKMIGDQKYIYPFHLGSVWILKVYHL